MGGEYGAAIVYVSEMAGVERRGLMVVLVQSTINVGLLCALALVMLLQATISDCACVKGQEGGGAAGLNAA